MLRFDALRTPPGDGDILIEPAAPYWQALIDDNIRQRGRQATILAGVPLEATRQAVRSRQLGLAPDAPVIATGHQPEFAHPGVWAKKVAVHHVGGSCGTETIDLVVDDDAPGSWALRVPVVGQEGLLGTRDLVFAPAPAGSAYEGRAALDVKALNVIGSELSAALGERFARSVMPAYLEALVAHADALDAVQQHLAGRAEIDASLGADLRDVRVTEAFGGPFVADLLLNADRFAAAYNESLGAYRREQRVRGVHRPVPDLGRGADRVETALWIYQPLQARRRLWVERRAGRVRFYAAQAHVAALGADDLARDPDAALAELRPWVIRPRALILTLWARLLACDLFVHGIGGAKYDRITDGIFRRYYRREPPAYTCVSATLRLPLPRQPSTLGDMATARRRVRDWRYNPPRYIPDPPDSLLAQRSRLIRESDRLREARGPRIARREAFLGIRGVNAQLIETHPHVGRELADRLARIRRELESNLVADSREFFYALQPGHRLAGLAARLAEAAEQGRSG